MKTITKWIKIKILFVIMLLINPVCNGEIMGQVKCKNGELVVLESTTPACWTVQPEMYKGCFLVFNAGKTCVFASPECGKVTFEAVTINRKTNGYSKSEHTVYNGIEPGTEEAKEQKKTK